MRDAMFAVIVVSSFACAGVPTPAPSTPAAEVDELFHSLRVGAHVEFPHFRWDHIPALLAHADSTAPLREVPANPLSSEYPRHVSEGMFALWLIEGARQTDPAGYPSLAPLCLPIAAATSTDWDELSERNHAVVSAAYRRWWGEVANPEQRTLDPLAKTGLAWH